MNNYSTVFSPAEILLPAFHAAPEQMKKWAVIACDQFTSEGAYWESVRRLIGDAPSTFRYIMPEAYLKTPLEAEHAVKIARSMAGFDASSMERFTGYVVLERTLPNGAVRRGILGKIDLEAYDYHVGSTSPVRATEATVLERIPPRRAIRASAVLELPHILLLTDDTTGLFEAAAKLDGETVYDFDLMLGGGHVRGKRLTGPSADRLTERIAAYEQSRTDVVYAMGDGNHSLAAARAHWEDVKAKTGNPDHPARYALCEITPLGDKSLEFEPIYRLVKRCDPKDLLAALSEIADREGDSGSQRVATVVGGERTTWTFRSPDHALTVGTLQNFLDRYLAAHPGSACDYIHGEDSLLRLAAEEGSVGFLFDGIDKSALFSYVATHGALPRKTFSMGEAESKRYYLEARKIIE